MAPVSHYTFDKSDFEVFKVSEIGRRPSCWRTYLFACFLSCVVIVVCHAHITIRFLKIQSKLVLPLTCLAVGSAFAPNPTFSGRGNALAAAKRVVFISSPNLHGTNCPCCTKQNHGPNCPCCTNQKSGCMCMIPGACSVGCACACHL
mmetsp:Transcript_10904/g.19765  ORF Transcript_10904/g.19765 Transcript_10904/m.19765 type:complete len:147 (-) Transcript_10904:1960-2400(-)